MMDINNKKPRRARRTNEQLEQDILDGMEKLVRDTGFVNIPVTAFIERAGIDPNVFYRRYETVYDIYKALVSKQKYWEDGKFDVSKLDVVGEEAFYSTALKSVYRDLKSNHVMQKMLIWELTDDNDTTRETSSYRETLVEDVLSVYKELFKDTDIDITAMTALLLSGIFYLTLHNDISTFCLNDYSSDEGRCMIDHSIDELSHLLFAKKHAIEKQMLVAKRMHSDGIALDDICRYLEISEDKLSDLLLS